MTNVQDTIRNSECYQSTKVNANQATNPQYTLVTHVKDTQSQYWYKVVREANKYLEGSKTNLATNLSSGDNMTI